MPTPFVANTDPEWFDELCRFWPGQRVDEANFWSPRSKRPLKNLTVGEPVLLRLTHPHQCVAGHGFFAHFDVLRMDIAWDVFGRKNGARSRSHFYRRMADMRGESIDALLRHPPEIGCTVLRDVHLWADEARFRWSTQEGWKVRTMRGATERDPARAEVLLAAMRMAQVGAVPPEFTLTFMPLGVSHRDLVDRAVPERQGQGAFRVRLLDAYGGCAVTGERTHPVLEAAHIQPYLDARSNHVQNGLLLTREFHALFDRGYVGIGSDRTVMVSRRLRQDWQNGARYYEYDGKPLRRTPRVSHQQPSEAALEWHRQEVFLG